MVLVRTGMMRLLKAGDKQGYHGGTGPSFWSVEWFRDHDVAAVATDNITFEYLDVDQHPELLLVVHLLHLVEMGLTQGRTSTSRPWPTTVPRTASTSSCSKAPPNPSSTASGPRSTPSSSSDECSRGLPAARSTSHFSHDRVAA